jgi:hypothetical protein
MIVNGAWRLGPPEAVPALDKISWLPAALGSYSALRSVGWSARAMPATTTSIVARSASKEKKSSLS